MVMSMGRQLPHMLTPRSFISLDWACWAFWGSLAYFFWIFWISGWMAAICAEDLRVLISEKRVMALSTTVQMRMVRNTLFTLP